MKKTVKFAIDLIEAKLSELTAGLNHWGAERNKTDNTPERANECEVNIRHLTSAFDEIYSMLIHLKNPVK